MIALTLAFIAGFVLGVVASIGGLLLCLAGASLTPQEPADEADDYRGV